MVHAAGGARGHGQDGEGPASQGMVGQGFGGSKGMVGRRVRRKCTVVRWARVIVIVH